MKKEYYLILFCLLFFANGYCFKIEQVYGIAQFGFYNSNLLLGFSPELKSNLLTYGLRFLYSKGQHQSETKTH